jgi:hypothetical protein
MNPIESYNNNGTKTFWQRPEGKTGTVVLAGLGAAGAYLLYKILPFVITLLQNAIHATILGVVLFVLMYIITNKRFQTLAKYLFKTIMWHFTNFWVALDPVAILRGYVEELRGHIANIQKQLQKLQGEIERIKDLISENERNVNHSLTTAKAAQKRGEQGVVRVQGRQAQRLSNENHDLNEWLRKLEKMYNVLFKIREFSEIRMLDIENEVASAERRRRAGKMAGSAIRSAMAILNGGEGKELYDAAMERIQMEYSQEMGTLVDFLQSTGDMLKSMDIEDDVAYEKTIQMIDGWEQQGIKVLEAPKPVFGMEQQIQEQIKISSFASLAKETIQ